MLQKNEGYDPDADASDSGSQSAVTTIGRGLAQLLVMAVVLAIAFAATLYLVRSKPEIEKRPVFPTVYTVDTVVAEKKDHQPTITLYGEVVAGRTVELRSLVSGEITSINPKLRSGGKVETGETLLQIDRFTYEGQLREAKANAAETAGRLEEANARVRLEQSRLASGREQLEIARSDLERIEKLRERGTATEKQVEDRQLIVSQRAQAVEQSEINLVAEQARINQLEAAADRLAWRIEQSERDISNTSLVAPFDATIRSSTAEVGKLTTANDVLVSMYQDESLEARFVLTDERYGRLQADEAGLVGREIEIVWNVGGIDYAYPGTIDRIGAEIASARGGVEMFAIVGDGGHSVELRPGAFVEIRLPDRVYADHVELPDSALYGGDTVYVVENGELAERPVRVGAYSGDRVLVSEGIDSGDEVMITRISEISAGLKVRSENGSASSAVNASDQEN